MKKLILMSFAIFLLMACSSTKTTNKKEVTKQHTKVATPEKLTSVSVATKKIPVDPKVRVGKLKNGLTYYIRNNGKPEDKLELRVVVNAGSVLEDDDQQGLAHFMEHMNFNGTKNFKKNQLVDYLQSIGVKFGADLNAYTGFDQTVYILPIPSNDEDKLNHGFQIIEDWAFNTLLTDEEIEKERGVVLEEYRLGLGAEKRMMAKYLPKLMYKSKYAERLPIGKKEILENFTSETIKRFKNDWYRPDLIAIIAVGDVDADKLEAKIKEHFSKYPKAVKPRERKEFSVPNHKETFISITSDKEAAFNQVQLVYKDHDDAKPEITVKDYRKSMVEGLFSQMINNRLSEKRNLPNPPFVFGYSYHGGTYARTKNAYQSVAMSSPEKQITALKTLLEENERVKRYGFQQGEFKRAKKSILARMEKAYTNKDKTESKNYVREYIGNYLEKEPIPGIEWEYNFYKNELDNVQLSEVNALINKYLHKDNRVIILSGSDKKDVPKITEEQVKKLLEDVENSDIKPYQDKEVANSLMTKIPVKGSIVNESKDEKTGVTTLVLSNGAKVKYKKTDFKDDEILFEAKSKGGTSLYDTETYKKTGFANMGLAETGINGFNKTDLQKVLTGKIVRVRPYIGNLTEGMSGSATPKDLETLMQMTYLYFTALNKDNKAYQSYVNKQKAFFGTLLSNPDFYYQIKFQDFLNQNNKRYMGFPSSDKDWDSQDYNLAYNKYKERFANAGDFTFYFVGNIDEGKLKDYTKTYLASLPASNAKENFKDNGIRPLTGKHKIEIKKGTEPKSKVNIIFQGETTYDPKEAYLLKSLGEILSIKLIEELREEESGVYGVGARGSMEKYPYGAYDFTISFPCGPKNVEKLKNSALAELNKIIKEGPTQKDIDKIKETQLLEFKDNMKKNKFWMRKITNFDFYQEDLSEIFDTPNKIKELNAKDIQNVGKKYLSGDYIIGILNPEK